MYDRVLVPTDGSTGSAHVALQGIDLAQQYGAALDVLHVLDTDVRALLPSGEPEDELQRRATAAAERIVRHAEMPVLTVRLPETDTTVEGPEHARQLARDAAREAEYDATVTGVEQQVSVWIVEAEAAAGSLVIYVDPVTRRTSVVERT
jgi:nucleotide-binding universal stress UspA family protein